MGRKGEKEKVLYVEPCIAKHLLSHRRTGAQQSHCQPLCLWFCTLLFQRLGTHCGLRWFLHNASVLCAFVSLWTILGKPHQTTSTKTRGATLLEHRSRAKENTICVHFAVGGGRLTFTVMVVAWDPSCLNVKSARLK